MRHHLRAGLTTGQRLHRHAGGAHAALAAARVLQLAMNNDVELLWHDRQLFQHLLADDTHGKTTGALFLLITQVMNDITTRKL